MSPWYTGSIVIGFGDGFDWGSDGWRYKIYDNGTDPNNSSPSIDDSSWAVGTAPFGAAVGYQGDPFHGSLPFAKTYWPLNTTIWARRRVSGIGTFNVRVRYDNDVWVYWDGNLIFQGNASIADTPVFTMTSDGDGLLAVKVLDHGVANYFDGQALLQQA